MPEKLQFYQLRPFNVIRTDGDEAKWLGRIVKDYETPKLLTNYTPGTLSSPGVEYDVEEVSQVSLRTEDTNSTAIHGRFLSLASANHGNLNSTAPEQRAQKLYYYRVKDHDLVKKQVLEMDEVKAKLRKWLTLTSGPAFLIVGFLATKTGLHMTENQTTGHRIGGGIDPLAVAAFATGTPLPSGGVDVGAERVKKHHVKMEASIKGSCICAIEYKSLKRNFFSMSEEVSMGYGPQGSRTFADQADERGKTQEMHFEDELSEDNLFEVLEDIGKTGVGTEENEFCTLIFED